MTARNVKAIGSLAGALVFSLARSAGAQDRSSGGEPAPKVEFGVVTSGFLPPAHTYGLGTRVSIARKRPFTFEAGIDWMELGRKERYVDQVMWFYFWQVKQALATHEQAGPRFFVTYGTAGWVERTGDGAGPNPRFTPGFIPPLAPLLGFGGEHVVATHAAVRVEAQLVWLLGTLVQPRFSGGVSVPIGGYRR
jgi:hypothetical protein